MSHDRDKCCLAAERGDFSVPDGTYDPRSEFEQQESGGWTPLMWAARNGHIDCVHTLCHHLTGTGKAAILDAVNHNGSTALMVAATCGHAAIVAALVEAGADLYASTSHNSSTALHLASSCGNWGAFKCFEPESFFTC